jgi:hypothetical protein
MLIERIQDSSPKSEAIFIRKSASDGLFLNIPFSLNFMHVS